MLKHLNIKICGQVQGVAFRVFSRTKAKELNIFGFVQNEKDGSVYIEAEGEPENLEKFMAWCRQGPRGAAVSKASFKVGEDIKNFREFAIKY